MRKLILILLLLPTISYAENWSIKVRNADKDTAYAAVEWLREKERKQEDPLATPLPTPTTDEMKAHGEEFLARMLDSLVENYQIQSDMQESVRQRKGKKVTE